MQNRRELNPYAREFEVQVPSEYDEIYVPPTKMYDDDENYPYQDMMPDERNEVYRNQRTNQLGNNNIYPAAQYMNNSIQRGNYNATDLSPEEYMKYLVESGYYDPENMNGGKRRKAKKSRKTRKSKKTRKTKKSLKK